MILRKWEKKRRRKRYIFYLGRYNLISEETCNTVKILKSSNGNIAPSVIVIGNVFAINYSPLGSVESNEKTFS